MDNLITATILKDGFPLREERHSTVEGEWTKRSQYNISPVFGGIVTINTTNLVISRTEMVFHMISR